MMSACRAVGRHLLRGGAVLSLGLASAGAPAATTETLTILQNGEKVGYVRAVTDGANITVDYHVDQNGRGPKHRETLRLDRDGVPLRWTVAGTSEMGGAVAEEFSWQDGQATWTSQADHGSAAAPRAPLYVLNDDSPWATGVYARVLLRAPDRRRDVLPAGAMNLEPLRELRIGQGRAALPVTVYRMQGVDLEPTYLMLDRHQRLFAQFNDRSVVVREGYESEGGTLLKLGSELQVDFARSLQQRLAHRHAVPVRIRNVHVLDPASGRLSELSTVVVMRDRITAVLPSTADTDPPADQVIIDGEGGTLVPGLTDMHAHNSLQTGLLYLAAGVTSARDQGNLNDFLLDLMPRIEAGEIAGPRITPNGFIEGRSPFSARHGKIPETREEAVRVVDWYADRGYRQIKIYNSMTPGWVALLAAEAHRRGLGVTGHVPAFMTPDRAITDGYDEIAHINQLMLGWLLQPGEDTRSPLRLTAMARGATLDLGSAPVQATVALMKSHHTALDPTAVILERLMMSRAGTVAPGDVDYLANMPIAYQRYRRRTFVPLATAADDEAYRRGFAKVLETLRLLHEQGIRLLPGTDDGTGFTVHRELELYALAGIPVADVLRIGTIDCAEHLGRGHELGTIERGKLADFFLVAGDPTRDVRAIKTPRMVLKGGAVYFPDEIYTALSIKPFTQPPRVQLPAAKP